VTPVAPSCIIFRAINRLLEMSIDVSFKRAVNSMVRGSRGSVPAPRSRRLAICPSIFGGGGGDGGCGGQRATPAEPREPCSPTTDGSCM